MHAASNRKPPARARKSTSSFLTVREEAAAVLLLRRWQDLALQLREANQLTPGSLRALEQLEEDTTTFRRGPF